MNSRTVRWTLLWLVAWFAALTGIGLATATTSASQDQPPSAAGDRLAPDESNAAPVPAPAEDRPSAQTPGQEMPPAESQEAETPEAEEASEDGAEAKREEATARRPTFDKQNPEILAALKPICAGVDRALVRVTSRGRPIALGTIVDASGLVLTKASELRGGLSCKLSDGRSYTAQVFGIHEKTDLAMLKIDAVDLPTAQWSDAESPPVGYWVVTPKQNADPLLGIISVKPRSIAPPPGYIGVNMAPHANGVRIDKVLANSPAEQAGLRVNDIIVGINGEKITELAALRDAIQKNPVGTEITVQVLRGSETMDVAIELTDSSVLSLGPDRSEIQNEMGGRLSRRRLDFPLAIQHDTPLTPSECGGPLIDLSGHVVGVNIARAGRVDSLALPTATVRSAIDSLKSGTLAPSVVHKSEIEKIQARLAQIATDLNQVPQHTDELKSQLEVDNARLEELRTVFEDMQTRLADLERQHAQTAAELKAAEANKSKLQKEKERLEAQLQKLISGTN